MARSAKNLAQIPHRASAPDTGFSVDELSAELQNLEQDGGKDVRSEILTLLKTRLMTAKDFAKQRFERGRFLTSDKIDPEYSEELTQYILYMLWDSMVATPVKGIHVM